MGSKVTIVVPSTGNPRLDQESLDRIRVATPEGLADLFLSDGSGIPDSQSGDDRNIVFLSPEVIPRTGWLQPLLAVAVEDPSAGIVCPKMIAPDGTLQEAGRILLRNGSMMRYGNGANPSHPEFEFRREVDACSGGCFLVRGALLHRLRGISSAQELSADDFGSLRAAGFRVIYQPGSVVEAPRESDPPGTGEGLSFKQALNASQRIRGRRILALMDKPPMNDRSAGDLRIFNFLRMLAAEGHHVTFGCLESGRFNGLELAPYIDSLRGEGILVYPLDAASRKRFADGTPDRLDSLACLLAARDYDVAYLPFHYVAAGFIPILRELSPETRIVIDSMDVHLLRHARQALDGGSPALFAGFESARREELSSYANADAVITVTDRDREILQPFIPSTPVFAVTDHHPVVPVAEGFGERRDIVFLAGFRHNPNVDAALYFHREIWPLLKKKLPGIRWFIVGDSPPPAVLELASDDVIVTGYVPEIEPYLHGARVAVVPIRFGAGMKGKVAVAMAHSLPCVTTPVGAEGMGLVDGRDVLIAGDPEAFAESVFRIHEDRALWEALSAAGRDLVESIHGGKAIYGALVRALGLDEAPKPPARPVSEESLDRASDLAFGFVMLGKDLPLAAESHFSKVLAVRPGDDWALLGRGLALSALGRYAEAEDLLREGIEHTRRPAKFLVSIGKIRGAEGKSGPSDPFFREALSLEPEDPWVLNEIARSLARNGEFVRAAEYFGRIADNNHQSIDGYLLKASSLAKAGDARGELDALGEAMARAKMCAVPLWFAQIDHYLKNAASRFGETDRESAGSAPDAPEGETLAEIATRGRKLKKENGYEEAISVFLEVLTAGDTSVLSDVGDCMANLGRTDDAKKYYASAIELAPPSAAPHTGLGVLDLLSGDLSGAEIHIERALAIDGSDASALCALGITRKAQGRFDESNRIFGKALDADPSNPVALHELVQSAFDGGQFGEAELRLRNFLMFHPADANMLFTLAAVLYRAGRMADATDTLDCLELHWPEFDGISELRRQIEIRIPE